MNNMKKINLVICVACFIAITIVESTQNQIIFATGSILNFIAMVDTKENNS